MRRIGFSVVCLFVGTVLVSQSYDMIYDLESVKASKEIKGFIREYLLTWINDPVIINAVKETNAKNAKRTAAAIAELDAKWSASNGIEEWMKPYFESPAAKLLMAKQQDSGGLIVEMFVMDFQGCNVALSAKTSDFLQGDEDKFRNSFGKKAVFVDRVRYDASSDTSSMQISLPVWDATAKAMIGAITVTIDMAKRDLLRKWRR